MPSKIRQGDMDEIIREDRSSRTVWTAATIAVVVFVTILLVATMFGNPEVATTVTN